MKLKAAEVKVGDQVRIPELPELKLFIAEIDAGIITIRREDIPEVIPSRYYEQEFDLKGFERPKC